MRIRSSLSLLTSAVACAALSLAPATQAHAEALRFGPSDVHSAFYVAKSENENQVHYAVRVDAACHPMGKTPVFAYWRRLKDGARVDAPLEGLGTRFYGAADDQTVSSTADGGHVRMHVKAVKQLVVDIWLTKKGKSCSATAITKIGPDQAHLDHAYLQLGMLGINVKHVDIYGQRISDGKKVNARLR